MSSPIGATHDLEEMIWRKKPVINNSEALYTLTFCDSVTGGVKMNMYHLSMNEALNACTKYEELYKLKCFAYEEKEKYIIGF